MKVFLGGTSNGSKWRDEIIPMLKLDYFNPVVDNWEEENRLIEKYERLNCDFVLYVITPEMKGVYSIAEAVDDSNKRPYTTVFVMLKEYNDLKFTDGQLRSLYAVCAMIKRNRSHIFDNLKDAANFLNSHI